ncbi:polcalcin Bra n 2-like [Momordica charantia]|uniref:Polcalcin Bra n 2-like n=1 Tax=Momordica charantia TaxID=3673 RepID=A0A6J1CQR0_MOMCH|nr:polcalcin Bra n 2-like [Momordica charantia]
MADSSGVSAEECERVFKRFDANGDGKISATELGDALKGFGVSTEDAKTMMDAIDKDGDGFISLDEFSDFAKDNRALMKDFAKAF